VSSGLDWQRAAHGPRAPRGSGVVINETSTVAQRWAGQRRVSNEKCSSGFGPQPRRAALETTSDRRSLVDDRPARICVARAEAQRCVRLGYRARPHSARFRGGRPGVRSFRFRNKIVISGSYRRRSTSWVCANTPTSSSSPITALADGVRLNVGRVARWCFKAEDGYRFSGQAWRCM